MVFKSLKVLIATVGLNLGSAAIAEDLVYFTTDVSDTDYYYDADTIRRNPNNTVEVWIKKDASKDKTVSYRIAMARLRINCSDETVGILADYQYRPDGSVLKSNVFQDSTRMPIPPSTTMDTLFKIVCPK